MSTTLNGSNGRIERLEKQLNPTPEPVLVIKVFYDNGDGHPELAEVIHLEWDGMITKSIPRHLRDAI